MELEQFHPLWKAFIKFAKNNNIGLTYKDDWQPWWDAFLAGAEAQKKLAGAEAQKKLAGAEAQK